MKTIDDILICGPTAAGIQYLTERMGPMARRVLRVDNPEQALARLAQDPPRAVLIHIDERCADGSLEAGLALARQIRSTYPDQLVLAAGSRNAPELILDAMRAGMGDYLALDQDDQTLGQVLARAVARTPGRRPTGRLVAVYSLKGGQGTTTIALNLSDQLQALDGNRVLLADFNLYRGDAALFLEQDCDYTPFDLVRDLPRMDGHLLFSSLGRYQDRFHFLGSNGEIGDADQLRPDDLTDTADLLKRHFDSIVVDLPADCTERTLALLGAADQILLVVQQDLPAVKSMQSLLAFFREIQPRDDRLALVVNRFEPGHDLGPAELPDLLGCPVAGTIANDHRTLTMAANQGRTLAEVLPQKKIHRDFKQLALKISGRESEAASGFKWRALLRRRPWRTDRTGQRTDLAGPAVEQRS